MSENRLLTYLTRMQEASGRAASYVDGLSRDDFHHDFRTRDAVIANIAAIGECAVKIMENFPEFANDHSEIPWRDIHAMRNRVAHQYFEMDIETVWLTVTSKIPELLEALDVILDRHIQGE